MPTITPEWDLDRLVEACIGVMGNPLMKGSYAAPREAFRKILSQAQEEARKEGQLKEINKVLDILHEFGDNPPDCLAILEEYLGEAEHALSTSEEEKI